MELTTVQNVKTYLRLTVEDTSDDGMIQIMTDGACVSILSAISRNILAAQYSETRNGTGTNTLVLANTPVTAVGSLAIVDPRSTAGAPAYNRPLTLGVDFTFTSSSVKLFCGAFPRGVANIAIEYSAGFAAYPADLVHVATKWAALRYRENERLGQTSKTLAGETVLFDTSELSGDMQAVVNRYSSKIPLIASAAGLV